MLDHCLDKVGAHLDLADACLDLRVRDAKARALGIVETYLPDADLAKLADSHAGAAQDLADDATPDIAAADVRAGAAQVVLPLETPVIAEPQPFALPIATPI